jgi:hypothetical protein
VVIEHIRIPLKAALAISNHFFKVSAVNQHIGTSKNHHIITPNHESLYIANKLTRKEMISPILIPNS